MTVSEQAFFVYVIIVRSNAEDIQAVCVKSGFIITYSRIQLIAKPIYNGLA